MFKLTVFPLIRLLGEGRINLNTENLLHLITKVCFMKFISVTKCNMEKKKKKKQKKAGHHV